jgi:lytic murein transglycosylase
MSGWRHLSTALPVGPGASRFPVLLAICLALTLAVFLPASQAVADTGFRAWLEALRPEAEAAGVSRKTFDAAFRGVRPNLKLPDLILPGRKAKLSSRGQSEFTSPPSKYINRAYLARLAKTGRSLARKHKTTLERIEREIGVDRYLVLSIWGRETAFGAHELRHDAIRVIATQAYLGRRKDLFRKELLAALRMLEAGVPRSRMRSSWAGALGLTQFMPSEYFVHAYDLDGDGTANIFTSVPDALASAASQLKGKGWVSGDTWGREVIIPKSADCAFEGPTQERSISDWAALGFRRADGKPWSKRERSLAAYLMSPGGAYGPNFLVFQNFKVIRLYNTSDLYAVFVGNLADRIAGGGDFVTPWGKTGSQKTGVIAEIQQLLQDRGYDVSKVDGKVGSNTRRLIGTYQRASKIKVDCWPTDRVLAHLRKTGVP